MANEDQKTLSISLSLVDVGKISPFSCLTLLLHLKQGKLGLYWHLVSLFIGDFPIEGDIHCRLWDSLFS